MLDATESLNPALGSSGQVALPEVCRDSTQDSSLLGCRFK